MEHPWWQSGIIYQVYPRSFQDSDGDGVGDLRGIERRLDHLTNLGVQAVWISPFYPSPMADFGYDVSDYCNVDPLFGTLDDFDRLLAAAHARGLRLILDLVPCHTSEMHPWFQDSRRSRDAPKRDWYVWCNPKPDGGPPTNWISEFGGPAWTFDEATGQYYLHIFLHEQPALNWRNPEVQAAILDAMRFWLDRGVDGFRIDAFHCLAPDDRFRDNPPNPDWDPSLGPARRHRRLYTTHRPECYQAAREMRALADSYPDRVLIGEAYGTIEQVVAYYGEALDGFHLPFNFHLITVQWEAARVRALVDAYEAALQPGAWPNWVLGNHDRPRIASRVGPAQARVAAMLLLTLRGTPTLFQGDELGLPNGVIPSEAVQDPWEKNVPGQGLGRDPVRTPMLWDNSPHAGFTTGRPWLPQTEGPGVAEQSDDPHSMLTLHRRIIALRRKEPALTIGNYRGLASDGDVFVYERAGGGRRLRVALNFSPEARPLDHSGRLLLSTDADRQEGPLPDTLGPDEGVIFESAEA